MLLKNAFLDTYGIFEVLVKKLWGGKKLTGWGKNWPVSFFPRGKNWLVSFFPRGKKLTGEKTDRYTMPLGGG